MNTTAFTRALQLIAWALTITTVLFALTMSVVHAAPGDGPGSQDPHSPPRPPLMHASENPVVFGPKQDVRYIDVTAKPYTKWMRVISKYNDVLQPGGAIIGPDTFCDVSAEIHFGTTYKFRLETLPEKENGAPHEVGPWLTVTTVRPEVATTPDWGPPELGVNPTLIPRVGDPPATRDPGALQQPERSPRTTESPERRAIS